MVDAPIAGLYSRFEGHWWVVAKMLCSLQADRNLMICSEHLIRLMLRKGWGCLCEWGGVLRDNRTSSLGSNSVFSKCVCAFICFIPFYPQRDAKDVFLSL